MRRVVFTLVLLKARHLNCIEVFNLNLKLVYYPLRGLEKDLNLLKLIQSYFGVGKIHKHGENSLQFRIRSVKELPVLINHFEKYPLISQKLADYKLFKEVFNLILQKEHLTMEGLRKIVALKASMNLGLPDQLCIAFPGPEGPHFYFIKINITPAKRPSVLDNKTIDPQ